MRKEELSISFVMDMYSTTNVDRHALVADRYRAPVDLYLDTSGGFRVESLEYEGAMVISRALLWFPISIQRKLDTRKLAHIYIYI